MVTARQRSGLRGVSEFRRFLRRLPVDMRKEIGEVVASTAMDVQADMYNLAPKDSYRTARNIESSMSADKLVARVGFLKQEDLGPSSPGFVARFIEFGTKGANGVGAQPARPFIAPAGDVNEEPFRANVREVIQRLIGSGPVAARFGYE